MRKTCLMLGCLYFLSNPLLAQQWKVIAPMKFRRARAACMELPNHKLLVVGGEDESHVLSECEIYDPATNTWQQTGSLNIGRFFPGIARLPSGRILVGGGRITLGGYSTNTCEIYESATGNWRLTSNLLHFPGLPKVVSLPDSSVLFIGGFEYTPTSLTYLNSVEHFDPTTENISSWPSMLIGMYGQECVFSSAMKGIVVIGGLIGGYNGDYLRSTQFFSLETKTWSFLDSLAEPVMGYEQMLIGPAGEIDVLSGHTGPANTTTRVQSLNPLTRVWNTIGAVPLGTDWGSAYLINSDSILMCCGLNTALVFSTPISSEWFNLKDSTSSLGPPMTIKRTSQATWLFKTPQEGHCLESKSLYVFGGNDSVESALSECEVLTLSNVPKSPLITLNPQVIFVNDCDTSAIPVTVKVSSCDLAQLTSVQSVDSTLIVNVSEPVPFVFPDSNVKTLHIKVLRGSTGKLRLIFQTAADQFIQYIQVTRAGNARTMALPSSIVINGSICTSNVAFATIRNISCGNDSILAIDLKGSDSAFFKVAIDSIHRGKLGVLTPNDSIRFLISWTGADPRNYQTLLHIRYIFNGTIHDTTLPVIADIGGSNLASLQLRLSDIANASPGDTITVPLRVYNGKNILANGFEMHLRYNTDFLQLVTPGIANTNAMNTFGQEVHQEMGGGRLTVEGPLDFDPAKSLINLRFLVFATDTNCTTLSLRSCSFTDTNLNARCVPLANIDSSSICVSGCGIPILERAMHDTKLGIQTLTVDNLSKKLIITYERNADPLFSFYNAIGSIQNLKSVSFSSKEAEFDLTNLPAGLYFVGLQNNNFIETKKFIILR